MTEDFYKSKEQVNKYIDAAKKVNSAPLIKQFSTYLPKGSSVLELGSGPGTDWRLLNEYYQVTGSDFSEEFLNYLRKENPKGEFLQIDASSFQTNHKFNGIYSNKVLHHLTDQQLLSSIECQFNALSNSGYICHSFWRGEGTEDFNGMFVNYHSVDKLKTFFEPFFNILQIEIYEEFKKNDSLLIIAKKNNQIG